MLGVLTAIPLIAAGNLVRVSLHQYRAAASQLRPTPAFHASLHNAFPRTRRSITRAVECTRASSQLSRTSECEARASASFSAPPVTVQPVASPPSIPLSLLSLLPLLPLTVADRVLAESVPLFENGADVLTAAGSGEPVTNGIISLLFGVAVVGLVVLTGGVAYLAYTDWQDKREMEKLAAAEPVKRPTATSEIRAAMKSPPRATPKGFGKKSEKEIAEEGDA